MTTRAPAITVRPAEPGDDARIAAIDAATWSPSVSPGPPPAAGAYFRPGVDVADTLVAEVDGTVEGFVLIGTPAPLAACEHVQMIRGLGVDPAAQRGGIGRALVEAAIEAARARGARRLRLRVLGSNQPARRLYARCGFEEEGVLRGEFHLDGRDVDDHLLARRLVP